jgi:hypothetical protein
MEVMTFDTQLVAGIEPEPRDPQIADTLARARLLPGHGAQNWRVAVRNGRGQIYRTASLDNLEQFAYFDAAMERLGLADELPDDVDQVDGFDAIYRP